MIVRYQCTINKLECLGEWAYRSALKETIYSNECNETQVVQNSSFRKMPCCFQIKVGLCTTAYVGKDVVQDSYISDPFSFELNSSKVRHFSLSAKLHNLTVTLIKTFWS